MRITKSIDLGDPTSSPIYLVKGDTPKDRFLIERAISHLKEASSKPLTDSLKCEYYRLYVPKEEVSEIELAAKQLSRTLNKPKVEIPACEEGEVCHVNGEELYRIQKASQKVSHMLTQIPEYYGLPWPLKQCVLGQRTYAIKNSEFRKYQNG